MDSPDPTENPRRALGEEGRSLAVCMFKPRPPLWAQNEDVPWKPSFNGYSHEHRKLFGGFLIRSQSGESRKSSSVCATAP